MNKLIRKEVLFDLSTKWTNKIIERGKLISDYFKSFFKYKLWSFKFSVRPLKSIVIGGFLFLTILGIVIISCNFWVKYNSKDRLYSDINSIPAKNVALLLGTVKKLRYGNTNRYFQYRIDAAVQLYKAGKIKHILASGSNNSIYYNEPRDMQKALMEQGIPKNAITLDYAGFRTLDSVIRCKEVFLQDDVIVVSQKFHNERAIFIGDSHSVNLIGFNARDVPLSDDIKTPIREYLARFKAVLDLYVLRTKPKFLGDTITIDFSVSSDSD